MPYKTKYDIQINGLLGYILAIPIITAIFCIAIAAILTVLAIIASPIILVITLIVWLT